MKMRKSGGNTKKGRKALKIVITAISAVLAFILIRTFMPARTPVIKGGNSITEYEKVSINGEDLQLMIRGNDRENPVLVFVHGGPCCSEIPYVRKYQKDLEKEFTIVHYDQRGSGKSYRFGTDYSSVTAETHVNDLIALTEYIEKHLETGKVILLGHSYGTYIATQAAAKRPDLYSAYIGIGQMSDTVQSELNTLEKCIAAATEKGDSRAATELKALKTPISNGEAIVPRSYVGKYGFGARLINDDLDYVTAFLFGPEYNLRDAFGFYKAVGEYQDSLVMEGLTHPITEIVNSIDIPVYFVMGRYDGMTSPEAAGEYLSNLKGNGEKKLIIFEESAHYPQFEEKDEFCKWMKEIKDEDDRN